MFLKEIEMQGFKSFADKTKISFDGGVTAVVGPNGSGKSNITESLRWALGESSAKSLRGGKMPDVIFAGTENRKPLNYAQVTVILDNSDNFIEGRSTEIKIERHIYRNGDSDYLIDGKKVRLRDIHDLFMDTGLGRDSFSIISQGRVEDIFKSKSEERRMIFEEAAGVLKYKTRKKETQSKLTQTQDNLDRLEDIIYELETQIKPLKKQAEVARQFLALDEERKTLHLNILVEDIELKKADLTSYSKQLETVKADLQDYANFREKSEEEHQILRGQRQELQTQISSNQADVIALNRLISDLKHQLDVIQLASSQKDEKQKELHEQLGTLQEERESLLLSIAQKENLLVDLGQRKSENAEQTAILEQELEHFSENPDQMVEAKRDAFVKLLQEEAKLSNQLTAVNSDIESYQQISQTQSEELQKVADSLQEIKKSYQEALQNWEDKKLLVQSLLKSYREQSEVIAQSEQVYQENQQKMFKSLDVIKAKEARQSSLNGILKSHSQFYSGVKSVLQNAEGIGGIIGAVSEHISFERHYQTAMEIALGGSSQNIIVSDEAAAKRSIDYLKKNRQGRATFLPLTTIKERRIPENQLAKLKNTKGFLGIANQLVQFEDYLAPIFQNLLGTTAIFETIEQANQAARTINYSARIVTLDGTEIRPGGSFSGGANRQNNITFIKPELDELTLELENLKREQATIESDVSRQYQDLETLKKALSDVTSQGEAARLEEQKAEIEYHQLEEKLTDIEKTYNLLSEGQGKQTSTDLTADKERLELDLEKIATKKASLSAEIESLKENKDTILQQIEELREKLSQVRLLGRDIVSEQKFEGENLNVQKESLSRVTITIQKQEQLLEQLQHQSHEKTSSNLQENLREAEERKKKEEERAISLRFELEDKEAQIEDLASMVQKESQKNEGLIRQQAQCEAKLQQVQDHLRQFAATLSTDYQLSFDEAKEQTIVLEDLVLAKEELSQLETRIKRLGPVNVDAIAQFEEVDERLSFLTVQKEDLDKAKNLLLNTINDMDDEVKTRFKATFEAIRESFKVTFTQMFGGGSADLILTDDDLLTAGVDITVQPPGKKIQSLNLMSGGEKSLTALALLFAIIRVKTVPFVIFDEVEAALDEANVKRFGDYLNRFDQSSQFIVVTHRRGTMAAANSIYGVTMQESGVSKILSVKLKEAENLIPGT